MFSGSPDEYGASDPAKSTSVPALKSVCPLVDPPPG
ncbi:unannotated protein [freshwater metagenome]|uniref:Unannotated protein n=1 Tax=freshwater metagenome TaxID=449393 RepID=A0A6J6IRB9_9ZZZZ